MSSLSLMCTPERQQAAKRTVSDADLVPASDHATAKRGSYLGSEYGEDGTSEALTPALDKICIAEVMQNAVIRDIVATAHSMGWTWLSFASLPESVTGLPPISDVRASKLYNVMDDTQLRRLSRVLVLATALRGVVAIRAVVSVAPISPPLPSSSLSSLPPPPSYTEDDSGTETIDAEDERDEEEEEDDQIERYRAHPDDDDGTRRMKLLGRLKTLLFSGSENDPWAQEVDGMEFRDYEQLADPDVMHDFLDVFHDLGVIFLLAATNVVVDAVGCTVLELALSHKEFAEAITVAHVFKVASTRLLYEADDHLVLVNYSSKFWVPLLLGGTYSCIVRKMMATASKSSRLLLLHVKAAMRAEWRSNKATWVIPDLADAAWLGMRLQWWEC